uniref:PreproLYCP n=1 Tax=Lymnaea stagnalis TaxID=6523 RepID=Q26338_LYMST|nr:preproLYCP [Lymnaea stagnalis]
MAFLRTCLILAVAFTFLVQSVASDAFIVEEDDLTGYPTTIDAAMTTIRDRRDTPDKSILLNRLRRSLAQMYVGNHHFNENDLTSTHGGSRRWSNRKHQSRIYTGAQLSEA